MVVRYPRLFDGYGKSMISIWKHALVLLDQGEDFCIGTIVSIKGSSPRHVGTKFIVKRDGTTFGTIGGGLFEARVTNIALNALKTRATVVADFEFSGQDSSAEDMLCGGSVRVLIEYHKSEDSGKRLIYENLLRLDAARGLGYLFTSLPATNSLRSEISSECMLIDDAGNITGWLTGHSQALAKIKSPKFSEQGQLIILDDSERQVFVERFIPHGRVYVFGAGHVGISVVHLASYVGLKVTLVDDRAEFANFSNAPDADEIVVVKNFDDCMSELNVGNDSYIVIVTRGHSHDKSVLGQALKTPANYIGRIGSKRKIKIIFDALLMEGFSESELKSVHSPIGLPIGGETPE
ncbi:MAG: XdhC family protein, partial [Desulfomonilaceae bacterium]